MLGSWRTGTNSSPLAEFHLALDSFDGPFELLVNLIENQGFDITTISLVRVTSQYLAYVQRLQQRAAFAEATAEFLAVASQLLLLKSQAYLPGSADEREVADAEDLADRLRVYSAYRKLATELDEIQSNAMPSFFRTVFPVGIAPDIPENAEPISELILTINRMIDRPEANGLLVTIPILRISLRQRIESVSDALAREGELTFDSMASECQSRLEVIYTFLAVLYLVARRDAVIRQKRSFGPITIRLPGETD